MQFVLVEFSFAEGKTDRLRMYTRGGRAAVIELSWSRLLEGTLQERERSQKSEETYFTLLILSIVLNEGHSRPRAHLCISPCVPVLLGGQQAGVTGTGRLELSLYLCLCVGKLCVCVCPL